ncbi:hypothetical protein F5Y14DRAFT_464365 [Nemania sp. NC0429]|nr:hypothetical protein F5Y14DRAFT_464365 [Nemania sp. NC0429]
MGSRPIIQGWVDSVSESTTPVDPERKPPAKRRRLGFADRTLIVPDPGVTPEPMSLPQLRPHSRSESPMKGEKASLTSRSHLSRLEKPVSIVGLGAGALAAKEIPGDIRGLFNDLRAAVQFKHRIVPYEVRPQMLDPEGDIPDTTFREPAVGSEQYRRLEAAWNNHVHTPLLELVFGSDTWNPEGPDAYQPVVVRFEAVMGATIVGSAIPFTAPPPLIRPDVACSISLDSLQWSSITSGCKIEFADVNPSTIQSSRESKKVDYVLVMYLNKKEKLLKAIYNASFDEELGYGYVNQTLLPNLLYDPIAVGNIHTSSILRACETVDSNNLPQEY